MAGMFNRASDRFAGDIGKYADDQITSPELLLRLVGEGGNVAGEAIDAVIPDTGLMEYLMGTQLGRKALEGLSGLQRDYPRASRNAGSALNATGLIGLAGLFTPKNLLRVSENMPNDLPDFYKGPLGAIKESGRAFKEGVVNRTGELLSPGKQAFIREQGTSPYIQEVALKAANRASVLKPQVMKRKEQLEAKAGKPLKQTELNSDPAYKKLDTEYKKQQKIVMGQAGQNYLLNNQFGQYNKLLQDMTGDFNIGTGPMSPQTLKEFVPELPQRDLDSVFRAISQQQGMKKGIMVNRIPVAQAAGDLGSALSRFKGGNKGIVESVKDYFSGKPVGKTKQRVMTHTKIGKVFADRPVKEGFKSFDDLMESATSGKGLNTMQKNYLSKNPKFKEMFDSGKLSGITDKTELVNALESGGVKVTSTMNKILDKGFSRKGTKPFEHNGELIQALEKSGVSVYNKAKALKGDPVLVVDATRSSALDLGGVNIIQAVYPDGRKVSFINDKNDLLGMTPPGAEDIVSVSVLEHHLAGGNKILGKRERPSAPKVEANTDLFGGSNYQKQQTQDLINYKPTVKPVDYARAGRNAAVMGGLFQSTVNPDE